MVLSFTCDDKKYQSAEHPKSDFFFFIVILISAKLLEVQKALSQVKMEIGELSEQVLPGLVQELGELQATSILKGDYELKIARQDYFTSKQDQVSAQNTLKK